MRHDSYGLVQYCNGVTEFKQVENKASNHSYGKWIFSRCGDSGMGTEIRLLLGACDTRLAMIEMRLETKGTSPHHARI